MEGEEAKEEKMKQQRKEGKYSYMWEELDP